MIDRSRTLWTLLGVTAGVATGIWLWQRGAERASRATEPLSEMKGEGDAAERVAYALADDMELGERDLSVDGISDGVVEITGVVADRDQRERVVAMAHNTTGVHTVVNRLVLEDEEARLEETRARTEETPIQHSGMGVGMGTRRQSPDTDPDRPSDRQKMVDRELEAENMEAEPTIEPTAESGPDADETPGDAGSERVPPETAEEEPEP